MGMEGICRGTLLHLANLTNQSLTLESKYENRFTAALLPLSRCSHTVPDRYRVLIHEVE